MSSFTLNPAFLRGAEVKTIVDPIGEAVVARAQDLAPKESGALAESIAGEWVEDDVRLVFRVAAHDFKGNWIEHGTANMEAEPFLGPAAMDIVGNLH